jgi:hypothetical protein
MTHRHEFFPNSKWGHLEKPLMVFTDQHISKLVKISDLDRLILDLMIKFF